MFYEGFIQSTLSVDLCLGIQEETERIPVCTVLLQWHDSFLRQPAIFKSISYNQEETKHYIGNVLLLF